MRSSTEVQVLLFDLGGVLVEYSGVEGLGALLPTPMSEAEVRSRWSECGQTSAFCLGHIGSQDYSVGFCQTWQIDLPPEQFLHEFRSWARRLYPGAAELLTSLRMRYRIAVLSNSNEAHWDRTMNELGMAALCDDAISSHHVGLAKPDTHIFQLTLSRLGVEPGRVAFFDDSAANVEAARATGMRAFHVRGIDQVRATLAREGML